MICRSSNFRFILLRQSQEEQEARGRTSHGIHHESRITNQIHHEYFGTF
jgi:hypothetical protein